MATESNNKSYKKLSKKEFVFYCLVSILMFFLSCYIGELYIGYILIYLFFLWVTIFLLSRSNIEILDRIANFTIMVLLIAPVMVYLIILVIDILMTNFPSILYIEGSKNTWIGFTGSIIAGSMTMFAVAFTIYNENQKRREELSINSIPYINIVQKDFIDSTTAVNCVSNFNPTLVNRCPYPVALSLVNSSTHPARNVRFIKGSVILEEYSNYKNPFPSKPIIVIDILKNLNDFLDMNQLLPANSTLNFDVELGLINNPGLLISVEIEIDYFDFLKISNLKTKYKARFSFFTKNDLISPFEGSINFIDEVSSIINK